MMKAKLRKITNTGLRIAIMLLTLAFVYFQVLQRHDLVEWLRLWHEIKLQSLVKPILAIIIFLLIANVLTESLKWKFLISKLETVRLNMAITAVLSGMAVSMFLPNRVGDYLGRVFVLQRASHVKGILATLVGSFAQIIVTLLAGMLALLYFVPAAFPDFGKNLWLVLGLLLAVIVGALVMLVLFFQIRLLQLILSALFSKKQQQIMEYAGVFSLYSNNDLIILLIFSLLRYTIYTMQFYLMLLLFGVDISFAHAIVLISVTYLLMTLIPTITITELGIRGSVTVGVFGLFFETRGYWNEEMSFAVLAASSAIWLINLVLPAVVGGLLAFRLKFFRKNIDHV